jgi:hypothetical protein
MASSSPKATAVSQILNHLIARGLDDIFSPHFIDTSTELDYLKDKVTSAKIELSLNSFLSAPGMTGLGSPTRMSVPKTRYSYRHAAWIDFNDLLKYTSLVFLIAPTIERARIPTNQKIIHSYRFQEDNDGSQIFDLSVSHSSFRVSSAEQVQSRLYSVRLHTDISNFYDRINIHRKMRHFMRSASRSNTPISLNQY